MLRLTCDGPHQHSTCSRTKHEQSIGWIHTAPGLVNDKRPRNAPLNMAAWDMLQVRPNCRHLPVACGRRPAPGSAAHSSLHTPTPSGTRGSTPAARLAPGPGCYT